MPGTLKEGAVSEVGMGEGGGLGEEAEKEGQAWARTGYLQATR